MRLDAHYGMLPERAFEKRGFGNRRPATLEGGGKGGGGGGPSSQNVIQSNIPEYAKPYVMNMLGAAQNQLFQTSNGEITGFRPYQAYSTNPTDYFAGPSSLQQSAYNAAGMMQAPGQFGMGSQLAGMAGQQALGTQGMASGLANTALGYGQAGAGYGQAGQMFGAQGAQQANLAAQRAQQAAQMYGGMGARFGAQAAGLSPEAQRAGAEAAALGMQGLGYGGMGAGLGQQAAQAAQQGFGAGQQFMRGVTDPSQVSAFMSPYQQAVTDVAKAAAIRDAQMMEQGNRLAAARQGTYGGARQALASLERERNLGANLANIQAQGAQQAYDRALAQMQFGSNLGLQGLGAGVSALQAGMQGAGLGLQGLGTAMQGQQARLQGLQQAGQLLGQGMQGAQAGLQGVGQQIAGGQLGLQGAQAGIQGAQAGMQGAGLGLQGVGQATQAGQLGLQGAQAATQAGTALGQLGTQQQAADINAINLQNQLGAAQQQYQQNIINQAIQDYATAQQYPYMQLSMMSNLLRGLPMQSMTTQQYQAQPSLAQQGVGLLGAYGAMKGAFKSGGTVKSYAGGGLADSLEAKMEKMAKADPKGLARLVAQSNSQEVKEIGQDVLSGIAAAPTGDLGRRMAGGGIIAFQEGGEAELSEEEKKYLEENPYLQRSRAVKEALAPLGQLRNYDPVQKIAELGGMARRGWESFINEPVEKQAERFRRASSRPEQAASPMAEVPVTKPAAERTMVASTPANATPAAPVSASDTDREVARMKATAGVNQRAREERVAKAPEGETKPTVARGEDTSGIRGAMKEYMSLTGLDKPNAELDAYKKLIGDKAAALGERSAEAGRMNKAMAFLEFASNPRGFGAGAVEGMKSYLKGEAANKREAEKIEMDFAKIRADLTKAEREEAKGNFDTAAKFYNDAQTRTIQRLQATKPGEFEKMYAVYSQNETAAGRTPTFQGFMQARTSTDESARLNAMFKADTVLNNKGDYLALVNSKKPEDREKAAKIRRDLINEYMGTLGTTQNAGAPAGGSGKLQRNDKGELVYVP